MVDVGFDVVVDDLGDVTIVETLLPPAVVEDEVAERQRTLPRRFLSDRQVLTSDGTGEAQEDSLLTVARNTCNQVVYCIVRDTGRRLRRSRKRAPFPPDPRRRSIVNMPGSSFAVQRGCRGPAGERMYS